MTDHNDHQNDPLAERMRIDRENAAKLEAWKQQKKAEAEQQRIAKQRADLEAYLSPRRQRWTETTGSPPPADVVARWTQEHLDEEEFAMEAERMERLAQAEAEYRF